jgi:feruloyl esterase
MQRCGLLCALAFAGGLFVTNAMADCTSVQLPAATRSHIILRQSVSGSFTPATGALQADLPAFCRVAVVLTPTMHSLINAEVWLPEANWNGKLMAVGNGGWTGSIAYPAMAQALRRGYATASTDTGHEGASGDFALHQPEKLIDFGYRAVHETAVAARQIITNFYQQPLQHAYWNGCSAGGRQGMQAAQRYPEDFDGIVAGAPALDWTGRAASSLRVAQAVRATDDSALDGEALALLEQGALATCDAEDGLIDGVIEAPQHCRFDPVVLQCAAASKSNCLSRTQVATARATYAAAINPATGRSITALYPGSEPGWTTWGGASPFAMSMDHFRFVVTANPAWQLQDFEFARDVARAEKQDANVVNALNPDLRRFFRRGGKLLHYHGWSDPQISPGVSPQYHDAVVKRSGGLNVRNNYRLFMVPGMAHCAGGTGTSTFDMVSALEQWVATNKAPSVILAQRLRNGSVDRSRPLCPYPLQARYDGKGDANLAESFRCMNP